MMMQSNMSKLAVTSAAILILMILENIVNLKKKTSWKTDHHAASCGNLWDFRCSVIKCQL